MAQSKQSRTGWRTGARRPADVEAGIETPSSSGSALLLMLDNREHLIDGTALPDLAAATDYALVCSFDALHDMGDPVGAARHIRSTLDEDGTWSSARMRYPAASR